MRRLGLAALVLLLPVSAIASPAADGGSGQPQALHKGEIVRGHFVQDRTLAGFAKPLRTEGSFALIIGRGLIWRSTTPFEGVTVIRPQGILVQTNGQDAMRLTSDRLPGLNRLYEVLAGAASGNTDALQQSFVVSKSKQADGWQIFLTPKNAGSPTMAQLKSLTLSGHRFVEAVRIDKGGGDVDQLNFLDQVLSTTAPTADEEKLLRALGR